jgi:transposase
MVYAGVDLHRKRSQVAVVDEDGTVLLERNIASIGSEFISIFEQWQDQPLDVAFEATYGWAWFADLLAEVGIGAHMAHPLATKAIATARVKNDSVDAKTLAHLLRTNLLHESWIAPPQLRQLRQQVRLRVALRRIGSRIKAHVHALIAEHGYQPPVTDIFSRRGRRWLDELKLPDINRANLQRLLRILDDVEREIAGAEAEIKASFKHDPRIPRLTAIPGVGWITATMIIAEIGDPSRFPSARHLCAWTGLTPREHSSAAIGILVC